MLLHQLSLLNSLLAKWPSPRIILVTTRTNGSLFKRICFNRWSLTSLKEACLAKDFREIGVFAPNFTRPSTETSMTKRDCFSVNATARTNKFCCKCLPLKSPPTDMKWNEMKNFNNVHKAKESYGTQMTSLHTCHI